MNIGRVKFVIADLWRRLTYHELVYCLYERTRKGQLQWHGSLEDGGLQFQFHWTGDFPCLKVIEVESDKHLMSLYGGGIYGLYNLVSKQQNEPIRQENEARVSRYMVENC